MVSLLGWRVVQYPTLIWKMYTALVPPVSFALFYVILGKARPFDPGKRVYWQTIPTNAQRFLLGNKRYLFTEHKGLSYTSIRKILAQNQIR